VNSRPKEPWPVDKVKVFWHPEGQREQQRGGYNLLGFRSHSTSQMGCTLAMTKTPNRATTTDIARFWKKTDLVLSPDGTRNAATP
jgi:hypothetical protein